MRSIGLNIELPREQTVNQFLDLSVPAVPNFFVRKLMFIRYASAFVVFPGGFGPTHWGADELFEALTLDPNREDPALPVVLAGGPSTGAAWRPGSVARAASEAD